MSSRSKGFTLIELMIVVAIIGILATIGLNYFRHARLRAMRTEAVVMLRSIATEEKAYYGEHGHYTSDLANLSVDRCVDHYCYNVITGEDFYGTKAGSYVAVAFGNIETSDERLDILVLGSDISVSPLK